MSLNSSLATGSGSPANPCSFRLDISASIVRFDEYYQKVLFRFIIISTQCLIVRIQVGHYVSAVIVVSIVQMSAILKQMQVRSAQ